MADFIRHEDWGLQAIVRGPSTAEFWTADPESCFGSSAFMEIPNDDHHNSLVFGFPGLFDGASMLTDELQELYKPFYSSVSYPSPSQNSAGDPTTPSSLSAVSKEIKEEPDLPEPDHQTHEEVSDQKVSPMDKSSTASASTTAPYVPKYKRRKNQHKRVVLQVTAEELSSDKWAWRKYGQKPIKGSPYPRSYYRCSSSKGCLARKQVEQSCADPGVFIITYTAEHSHSQPTRRNALAGTVRHKFGSNPKSPTSNTTSSKAAKSGVHSGRCSSSSPTPCSDLSPGTPLHFEEAMGRQTNKDETETETDALISNKNGMMFPEFMFDDDFFSCFNDLDGFMSELGDGHCSTGTLSSESDFL